MNYWLTSDTHFGHANIIRYCERPFANVQEMDEALIENWNTLVKPGDLVWHLGDFAWVKTAFDGDGYLRRLNGQVHLIKGNHDSGRIISRMEFSSIAELRDWRIPNTDKRLTMCHYPMMMWNGSHCGEWHAHGHCHDLLPLSDDRLCMDVGVDTHEFFPVALDDFIAYMKKREETWKPLVMKGLRQHGLLRDGTPMPDEEPT